jgi:nucleoside triphosphate pyrophosphatase
MELLRSLGLQVDVVSSGYAEPPAPHLAPAELASFHAAEKLRAALAALTRPGELPVLTADTVVDLAGEALGKPRDAADAIRMLELLSGRHHEVHTAFALALPGVDRWAQERVTTRVRFYALDPQEIAEYVATGEPLDKAGAYGIQGRAAALVESIEGDFYAVMGLPLGRLVRTLRGLGYTLPVTK